MLSVTAPLIKLLALLPLLSHPTFTSKTWELRFLQLAFLTAYAWLGELALTLLVLKKIPTETPAALLPCNSTTKLGPVLWVVYILRVTRRVYQGVDESFAKSLTAGYKVHVPRAWVLHWARVAILMMLVVVVFARLFAFLAGRFALFAARASDMLCV